MFFDLFLRTLRPFVITWWLEAIDYAKSLLGYGFGTLAVDAMFGDLGELVESGRVEVDELGAGCWMGEESCQSGRITRG